MGIVLGTAAILAVPLIAMQFTHEVDWDLTDFITIGILLLGTGLAYEFAARKVGSARNRLILGGVFLAALLIIWADLAVGIFNIPGFSGN
ncbi:MAG: hypothetical protein JWL87_482 [Candidatus Adlerbacteria bacterium]|nr:hypothetical protein [Candidatus Adlerbacteria bacterium]